MRRFTERLRKLERRTAPQVGELPSIVFLPTVEGPARDAALARIQRLRARGLEAFAAPDGELTAEIVERFSP